VFASTRNKSGSWAEFTLAPADLCAPAPKNMSDEAAVNLLANATTAVALVATLKADGHRSAVITAAASELARMVAIEAKRHGITVIGVVRRGEVARKLEADGLFAQVVVADGGASVELRQAVVLHEVTAAIDAVAGPIVEALMEALPDGGTVYSIGRLSGGNSSFDVMRQLIGRGMRIEGFAIDRWFAARALPARLRAVSRAAQLLEASGGTVPARTLGLDAAVEALGKGGHEGKTLIKPREGAHAMV